MWTDKLMGNYLVSAPADAIGRAMVKLYQRQTTAEMIANRTSEHNGRGFSSMDAGIGSYMARWVMGGRVLTGIYLEKARKLAFKYRKQLAEIANEKARRAA